MRVCNDHKCNLAKQVASLLVIPFFFFMKALGDISSRINEGAGFTSAVSVLGRNGNNNYYVFENNLESKRIKTKTTPPTARSTDVISVSSGLLRFSISFYLNCLFIYFRCRPNRSQQRPLYFCRCFGLFSVRHFQGTIDGKQRACSSMMDFSFTIDAPCQPVLFTSSVDKNKFGKTTCACKFVKISQQNTSNILVVKVHKKSVVCRF